MISEAKKRISSFEQGGCFQIVAIDYISQKYGVHHP